MFKHIYLYMAITHLHNRLKQTTFESSTHEVILSLLVCADMIRNQLEKACLEFAITSNQYNILRILNGVYPEGHARCEISSRMLEKAPDITRLIDGLVSLGYVERCKSEQDKRLSVTKITEQGRKILQDIFPKMTETIQTLSTAYTEEECRLFIQLCDKLIVLDTEFKEGY